MSQLLDQLAPQMRAFFDAFFAGNEQVHSLEELRDQVGPELEITVGRHRAYQGPATNINGHLYLPRGAVHVERDMVYFTGADRRITFYQAADSAAAQPNPNATPGTVPPTTTTPPTSGTPSTGSPPPGTQPAPTPPSNLPPYQYTLVKIVELADPYFDDVPTMTRLFAGLSAAVPAAPGASGSGTPAQPGRAAAWAEAIAAQRTRNANVFLAPLESLTSPPQGIPARDIAEYKDVMYRMCTYLRDGQGTYYSKQLQSVPGAGGLPTAFPEGTTDEYRALNAREVSCEPGSVYCLVNLPDGWGTGVDRQAGVFKEILFKLVPAEGGGTQLVPISWGTRVIAWGSARARDFFDFCFFVAEAIPAPDATEPPPAEDAPQ